MFVFRPHLEVFRGYPWLCSKKLVLVVLRGLYGMVGTKLELVAYKASTLPAVLWSYGFCFLSLLLNLHLMHLTTPHTPVLD